MKNNKAYIHIFHFINFLKYIYAHKITCKNSIFSVFNFQRTLLGIEILITHDKSVYIYKNIFTYKSK